MSGQVRVFADVLAGPPARAERPWGLLVGAVVLVVRTVAGPAAGPIAPGSVTASAEQVLAERFARGEIDSEEYRRRLQTLRTAAP